MRLRINPVVGGSTIYPIETTLREFLADNPDTFSDEDIVALAAMQPGDEFRVGGGAAPLFTIERMED